MDRTPVRILLARHGETVFNLEGRWQGQTDSPLTERGRAQARELAAALSDDLIAALYSSDLGRAMDTARPIAEHHGLAVRPDARLREIDVGGFARLNRAEIDRQFPGLQQVWATTPAKLRLPHGEDLLDAQSRALDFFAERMPGHAGETIVVIAHGAICQAILVAAMGLSVQDLWLSERVDNCQISRLEWTEDEGLKLIELRDVRHLEKVGSLRGWRTHDTDAG